MDAGDDERVVIQCWQVAGISEYSSPPKNLAFWSSDMFPLLLGLVTDSICLFGISSPT